MPPPGSLNPLLADTTGMHLLRPFLPPIPATIRSRLPSPPPLHPAGQPWEQPKREAKKEANPREQNREHRKRKDKRKRTALAHGGNKSKGMKGTRRWAAAVVSPCVAATQPPPG